MTKEERAAKWDAELIPCKNHPEKRCSKSRYIHCRAKQCHKCQFSTLEKTRAAKWDAELIPCKNHSVRQCNKSRYVKHGLQFCSSCFNKTKQGKANTSKYIKTENGVDKRRATKVRMWERDGREKRAWYIERKLHGSGETY